jgi:hypothetical protein
MLQPIRFSHLNPVPPCYGASYTASTSTTDDRVVFYELNLEHAMSEANMELRNAAHVDIYSLKVQWVCACVGDVIVCTCRPGLAPQSYKCNIRLTAAHVDRPIYVTWPYLNSALRFFCSICL